MGLLDDAIREHLELKRRHGADPGEVERQEREALGAPPEAEVDADVDAVGEAPGTDAPEPEPVGDATTVMTPADVDADEIEPPPGEEEVPSAGHEADAPGYDEDPWLEEDEEREQEPAAEEPPTAEHPPPAPPETEPDAERPPGDDDVLEETPEFLQETPEHDRLWFEQKPPRDFDWDR
jgi:hypothetical protein